jgi:hypothetical protein
MLKIRHRNDGALPGLHRGNPLAPDGFTELSGRHSEQGGRGCVGDDRRDDEGVCFAFLHVRTSETDFPHRSHGDVKG